VSEKNEKGKSGKPVIVRTYSAGVHFGYLKARHGKEVDLVRSRRIWRWVGAKTLSEIALHGVGAGSKIAEPVTITLTEAIEIINCSREATKNLETAIWTK
jgi:hypothetical protein